MAELDMNAAEAALREYYDGQTVENMGYDTNPLLALMPKDPDAEGKYIPQPVIYETSQGASGNFAVAQSNQTPMQLAEFLLPVSQDYQVVTLDRKTWLASRTKKGAFIDFAHEFVDVAIQGEANRASVQLYRSGSGSIGAINGSGPSTGVITLSNPADVSNFGKGMTLQAAATDGAAPIAALGYVIARNVRAGTITVSATSVNGVAGTPSGWNANYFLLAQGDSNTPFAGLQGWLPSVDPTSSDNFNNVNRYSDSRLFGLYTNGAGEPVEEAVIDSALLIAREKGRPGHLLINYGSYDALSKALGSRRVFVDLTTPGGIKFDGIKITGPTGAIDVIPDRSCPGKAGFMLQMPTWKLYSYNPTPHIFDYMDGTDMLRVANADAIEARVGYYAVAGCKAPGWNGQISFGI